MRNLFSWVVLLAGAVLMAIEPAFAEDAAATSNGLAAFSANIGLGIAALGGALGQGKIIGSVVEAIGRNPGAASQMGTPWLLGVAFVESLVLLAFVIALLQ